MDIWRKKLGSWVLAFHRANGLFVYSLVFIHPALWVVFNYFLKGNINPYYPFVEICLLCKGFNEYYINLGRLGFWSITLAVGAARLVTILGDKWLRSNWRNIHLLNYLAFYFVSVHALAVGSDSRSSLFLVLFVISHMLVLWTIVRRLNRSGLKLKLLKFLNQSNKEQAI